MKLDFDGDDIVYKEVVIAPCDFQSNQRKS